MIEVGEAKNPSLIFIHGFMGEASDWVPIMLRLEKEYHSVAVNLPGHAGREIEPIDSFFDELDVLIAQHAPCFLVGYSMGGRVALEYTLKRKPEILGLILESCNPGISTETERETRWHTDKNLFNEIRTRDQLRLFLEDWYAMPIFGRMRDHDNFMAMLEKRVGGNHVEWQNSLDELSLAKRPDLWPQVSKLKTPTLYVAGYLDEKYLAIGARLQKENSKVQLEVVKDVSHNTHFENPDEFTTTLQVFTAPLISSL